MNIRSYSGYPYQDLVILKSFNIIFENSVYKSPEEKGGRDTSNPLFLLHSPLAHKKPL